MTNRVYGIDLGTTYSCVAYCNDYGEPVVIDNMEGKHTTPSVVYFEDEENVVVGETAKSFAILYPDQCIALIKRSMGEPGAKRTVLGKDYSPQEISSYILKKLVKDAEALTGESVTDVVITCPAYFDQTAREATRQAGELAGLKVHSIIPEPTAAALAYHTDSQADQVMLIYDLGGGTFDLSLVKTRGRDTEVVATRGNPRLGGQDWDNLIADYLATEFERETGIGAQDLRNDPEAEQELISGVEADKMKLSSTKLVPQKVQFDGQSAKFPLMREKFDELTRALLEETIHLTQEVIDLGREKGISTIDKLLLVGGSTFMPQVRERLEKAFPHIPIEINDPNLAVAKGAAIYGQKYLFEQEVESKVAEGKTEGESIREISEQRGVPMPLIAGLVNASIVNTTTRSFGVLVRDPRDRVSRVTNLIVIDTPLPTSAQQRFGTADDNQIQAQIQIYQNTDRSGSDAPPFDPDLCEPKEPIGQAVVTFARPLPQGAPLEVELHLDKDGLIKLRGRDLTTGGEISAEFKAPGLLNDQEMAEKKLQVSAISVTS